MNINSTAIKRKSVTPKQVVLTVSEHKIQQRIVKMLRIKNCITICSDVTIALMFMGRNQKARMGFISYIQSQGLTKGQSDLIVISKKEVIFVEIKKWGIGKTGNIIGKTKQTPDQVEFQKEIESRGFKYFLINSPQKEEELYSYVS
jgi:hypothetical protein